MAASLTSFVALFSCSWIFVLCQEPQEVTVKPGENATLQCRGHRDADIKLIEWSRSDLKSDLYVFYFRDGKTNENDQHQSFRGRVELQDPEMKDGDASVILKNVNINDTGTYECWIRELYRSTRRKRYAFERIIIIIKLTVTEPGLTAGNIWEGNIGLIIRLTAVCVIFLLLLAVGVFIVNKNMQSRPRPEKTTSDTESAEDSLNPSSSSV